MKELNAQRPAIEEHVNTMAETIPNGADATARDWAGFFAGLAQLLSTLLPLILPLFTKPSEEKK